MATATKPPASNPRSWKDREARADDPWLLRGFDTIYRFLASLKLAVFSLLSLAAVLAFGTFFESTYGTAAVQEYVYQSKGFALLLAFLAANIFCAAAIRFPWAQRQTGFVITHVGLLIVLTGSFVSIRGNDEGQVGIIEGSRSDELVRIDQPAIRVQELDRKTGEPTREYQFPVTTGAFAWDNDRIAKQSAAPGYQAGAMALRIACGTFSAALAAAIAGWALARPGPRKRGLGMLAVVVLAPSAAVFGLLAERTPFGPRSEVLTEPSDPFQLTVKDFLPASSSFRPVYEPAPDGDGVPMLRAALLVKPPGSAKATDALGGNGWIVADRLFGRGSLEQGPAQLTYQRVDGPRADQILDDFLNPPKDPLKDHVARIHYRDRQGKDRVYEWVLDEKSALQIDGGKVVGPGKSLVLPDSDLKVTCVGEVVLPTRLDDRMEGLGPEVAGLLGAIGRATDLPAVPAVFFRVAKGDGPEVTHCGWGMLPTGPTLFSMRDALNSEEKALVRIGYFTPPELSRGGGPMSGKFGLIEFLQMPGKKFYYRAFGRDGLKGIGPIALEQAVTVFGGGDGSRMPMQVGVRLDGDMASGKTRKVCEPVKMPRGKQDQGIKACLVELTVDGESKSIWLRQWPDLKPPFVAPLDPIAFQDVTFPHGRYRLSFDFDRRPLGFELRLTDFDPSNDPGTTARSSYRSDVELTDTERGVQHRPQVITMNEPLTHRGWTFYQSSFRRVADPETGREEGPYMSIFQVHYDPAWVIIYGGCLCVIFGTFTQFYMRSGIFNALRRRARVTARDVVGTEGLEADLEVL